MISYICVPLITGAKSFSKCSWVCAILLGLDCVPALNARVKIKIYSLIIVKLDLFVFVYDFACKLVWHSNICLAVPAYLRWNLVELDRAYCWVASSLFMLCLLYRCPPPFPVLIWGKKKEKQAKLNYPSLMFVDIGGYVLVCLGRILWFLIGFGLSV